MDSRTQPGPNHLGRSGRPATITPPPLPDGFTAEDDLRGGWRISRAGIFVGAVFPAQPSKPNGRWYARRYSKAAKVCRDQRSAIEHLTRHLTEENR